MGTTRPTPLHARGGMEAWRRGFAGGGRKSACAALRDGNTEAMRANVAPPSLSRLALPLLTALLIAARPGPASAQDWLPFVRAIPSPTYNGVEIDAPEGLVVRDGPSPEAKILRTEPGPLVLRATNYVEAGEARYYLDDAGRERLWDGRMPEWFQVPGTGRAGFIAGTKPAKLLKRETRDFFGAGPETAEVFEERVALLPETTWNPGFRRAESDFRLPVKIVSLREGDGGAWEAALVAYPSFDSNPERIPGPAPEEFGNLYRILVTRPEQNELVLRGSGRFEAVSSVLIPGTVWAADFSEGRIAALRLGWRDIEPPYEVSRLSPPQFSSGELLRFRFLANRLLEEPVLLEFAPDEVVGADYTVYEQLADLGGAPGPDSDEEFEDYLHRLWNITLSPDLVLRVAAPLHEGLGGVGVLDLESIGLGPSFESDLRDLAKLAKAESPTLPETDEAGWRSIREAKLGPVPEAQRGPETEF
jgi:hypothetical protein